MLVVSLDVSNTRKIMKKNNGFTLMNKASERSERAFTLIELLVVISIIGILAAMVTVSVTASQRQARDVARKSDLKQYQTSLEVYANKSNGLYPIFGATSASASLCTPLGLTTCSEDTKNANDSTYVYQYQSDGVSYVLWDKLENTTGVWVVCSNGQTGLVSSFSGGACPL